MGLSQEEGQCSLGTAPPVSLTSLGSWERGHVCLSADLDQQGPPSFPGCHWMARTVRGTHSGRFWSLPLGCASPTPPFTTIVTKPQLISGQWSIQEQPLTWL